MQSADGHRIRTGDIVYVRMGDPYPEPGKWRVREMRVARIGRKRLRLEPTNPRRRTGCYRTPDEVFVSRAVAKGEMPGTESIRELLRV